MRLKDRYGVPWVVELTGVIGHYGMITGLLNAFEMAPPPDAEQLAGLGKWSADGAQPPGREEDSAFAATMMPPIKTAKAHRRRPPSRRPANPPSGSRFQQRE